MRAAIGAATIFLLSVFARANAEEGAAAQAEALIREGVQLRQEGKDERALAFFQKAYDLLHSPRTEGQLGLAEMAVGYWLEAEQHLAEALESPEHPWVVKNSDTLTRVLVQVRLSIGEIALTGEPAGALVWLNGRPVGRLPLPKPIRAPKGKAEIELRAPGYASVTRVVHIAGGERQALVVTLDKQPANVAVVTPAATAQPRPTPVAVTAAPVADQPTVAPMVTDGGKPPSWRKGFAWGSGAGAVGALALGVIETVVWQGKRSDFSNHRATTTSGASPGVYDCFENVAQRGGPGCAALYDSAHTAQTVAILGYAAAGALALTSVVLFLGDPGGGRPTNEHALACASSLFVPSIACRLTF